MRILGWGMLLMLASGSCFAQYKNSDEHLMYRKLPMDFYPAQVCSTPSQCKDIVLALGVIGRETPEKLADFQKTHPQIKTIYFDSPGGNMSAAVKMGWWMRQKGYDTAVGGGSRDMWCLSACPFAFMGGLRRTVEEGGSVGVHQFTSEVKGDNPTDTAMDPHILSQLSEYVGLMGADPVMVKWATQTPSQHMKYLTDTQLHDTNIDNTDPSVGKWAVKPNDRHGFNLSVMQQQPGTDQKAYITLIRSPVFKEDVALAMHVAQPIGSNESLVEYDGDVRVCRFSMETQKQTACVDGVMLRPWKTLGENEYMFQGGYLIHQKDLEKLKGPANPYVLTFEFFSSTKKKPLLLMAPTLGWSGELDEWLHANPN